VPSLIGVPPALSLQDRFTMPKASVAVDGRGKASPAVQLKVQPSTGSLLLLLW
jgi:hypothetical protein